ncbi:MAG: glutamate--tRNA ligase family protein [Planctomycetota bacterium]
MPSRDRARPAQTERTRLAPSPTGALHLGNARTFLVNWALARQHGWEILLRIEDLDTPRVKPGVEQRTINTLAWLGLDWNAGPVRQADDLEPYRDAMTRLASRGMVYPCELTRSQIEAAASAPQEGTHESRVTADMRPPRPWPSSFDDDGRNWRFATPGDSITFHDIFAGAQQHTPAESVGDFVVWTKRNAPSYQLAVVVDDLRQGITQIVRGDDLLDSAARQMLLARELGATAVPTQCHLPLVLGPDGRRLAKRHGDTRLTTYEKIGVPVERVIGLCARSCGITAECMPMSAADFADGLKLDTIPRHPITFTPEDEQWLTHGT